MQKNRQYRVTKISSNGKRHISMMNSDELRKHRAKRLKDIRKNDLGLTQKDFANAVGVNLRTLQDWELGRSPMPRPVEILMNLMKKTPSIKKALLTGSF